LPACITCATNCGEGSLVARWRVPASRATAKTVDSARLTD
jgi:hypothetical protein